MKKTLLITLLGLSSVTLYAQVGIGTTTPKAFFNVATNKDVLFGADASGAGSKILWDASKATLRAGYVNGTQWDETQLGTYSFAVGYNTIASGLYSMALGYNTVASGENSTALGYNSIASNIRSTAIGFSCTASGANATAFGRNSTASGANSTAMGNNISTNGNSGAFVVGDNGGYVYSNTDYDQMMMRFAGGYMLYTDNGPQGSSIGVKLATFGNAWQTISDSTRKENFRSADGTSFLQKISRMRLGSWNYKGQDAKTYRHYGPMAQDFFAAFGHDELGIIGEDKSINQADFDGVNLIAIQALIQKVEKLEAENGALKQETASLRSDIESIKRLLTTEAKLTFKP